jgi:hypothetical protein
MSRPPLRRLIAALGLAAVVLTIGTGCGSNAGTDQSGTSLPTDLLLPDGDISEGGQVDQLTSLDCGVPIEVLQNSAGELSMTPQFPPSVDTGGDGTFSGSVIVTGDGVTGVAAPEADLYLVQSGAVVSTPLPKDAIGQQVDLGAAGGITFGARGSILSCASGEPLPAGTYDIYAVVTINQQEGAVAVAVGGPWPLTIN